MGKQYLNGVLYGTGEIIKFSPYIYSLEEREVGVFTDGKPLYQKTIFKDYNSSFVGSEITWNHGIANIDTCVDFIASANFAGSSQKNRLQPYQYNQNQTPVRGATTILCYGFNQTNTVWEIGSIWASNAYSKLVVTLFYTKTTDTPGSGHYTTNGGEAHHYSTTEQVIGTWVDNKPLYEKNYNVVSPTINATTVVQDASMSNIDTLVNCFGTFDRAVSGYVIKEILNSYENTQFYSFARVIKESPNSSEIGIAYKITADNSYTISNLNFTIQYTKATD